MKADASGQRLRIVAPLKQTYDSTIAMYVRDVTYTLGERFEVLVHESEGSDRIVSVGVKSGAQ